MTFESVMFGYLERDEAYDVTSFGGLEAVLRNGSGIGASSVPELFIDMVLPYHAQYPAEIEEFLADVVEYAERDISLLDIATRLEHFQMTHLGPSKRVFSRFLGLFSDRLQSYSLRRAALRGAYLSARGHEKNITRLSSRIVELEDEPDQRILSDAARIAGLILANRDDGGLVEFLREFENGEDSDQFKLELGLIELRDALCSQRRDDVMEHLVAARDHFGASYSLRDSRYEAQSFQVAIDLLIGFFLGKGLERIDGAVAELKKNAFAYDAYVNQGNPDLLLGAVAAQASAFTTMALRLSRLSLSLSEKTWLHAADVIKNQLLVAYTANTILLRRENGDGIDLLTRPRIEASLLSNHMHAAAIDQWLDTYGGDVEPELVNDIRQFMEDQKANPTGADAASLSASALEERLEGQAGCTEFVDIMRYRHQREIDNVSPLVIDAVNILHCTFADLNDFKRSAFRRPFLDLTTAVIEFLAIRLDSSFEVNKNVEYLFKGRNSNPVENDLQQDFYQWCGSRGITLHYEPKGVAGGRADLRYEEHGCRLYVEAKQEEQDASFETLINSYGSQTTQYQATSAKLGVMLVLDKTRSGQPPYVLEDAYKPMVTTHLGHARGVLVARVPALRPTPHEASKKGKK